MKKELMALLKKNNSVYSDASNSSDNGEIRGDGMLAETAIAAHIVTPRSLTVVSVSISEPFGALYLNGFRGFAPLYLRCSNLQAWNIILLVFAHWWTAFGFSLSLFEFSGCLTFIVIRVSSAKDSAFACWNLVSMSPMNKMNSSGPNIVPWGTPLNRSGSLDDFASTTTLCLHFQGNSWIHLSTSPPIPSFLSFLINIPLSTLSKALARFKYTTSAVSRFSSALTKAS